MITDTNLSLAPTRISQILIAESNVSTVESLINTLTASKRGLDYDVCTSHDSAVLKLFHSPPPYELVISSVHLAEMYNFLLLKHNRFCHPMVPFVVTTSASEPESSRRALEHGAFDIIPTPLDHEQTMRTIRVALWHNRSKALIAFREKVLETYLQHLEDYSGDKAATDEACDGALSVMLKAITSVNKSILRLSVLAANVKDQVRKRALARLNEESSFHASW